MSNNTNNISTPKLTKGYKFNFIDVILVLLCLAIIGGCVYVFSPKFNFDLFKRSESVQLQYTIEIQGVDEEFIEKIKENNNVLDSVSKSSLGSVVAVDYNTRYSVLDYTINEEGIAEGILVDHPNKYNVIVTISATAEYESGTGYSINGRRIAIGELIDLKFPDYTCQGHCIAISI